MADESYENLLDFFDRPDQTDQNVLSTVDNNLSSDGSSSEPKEDSVNISLESSRVLSEIDNLLNESSNNKDGSDAEDDTITPTVEKENIIAGETSEILEKGGCKRKAEDDLREVDGLPEDSKSIKLGNVDSCNHNEVDDSLLDEVVPGEDDFANQSFEEMAALLDQCDEESEDQEGGRGQTEQYKYRRPQISSRLRELKEKYKSVLFKVHEIYSDKLYLHPNTKYNLLKNANDPIVYRENVTDIVGFESLQEFIDNNHPLWSYDRQAFIEMLKQDHIRNDQMMYEGYMPDYLGYPNYMAGHVNSRWGHQNINPRASLGVLRVAKDEMGNNTEPGTLDSADTHEVRPQSERDNCHKTVAAIMEMDIEAISKKLLERELERKKMYFENQNRTRDYYPQSQNSSGKLLPCEEVSCLMKQKAQLNNWSIERTAEAVVGIQEAASLTAHYRGDTRLSEEQAETILDMEDAYGKIVELSVNTNVEDEDNTNNNKSGFMSSEFLQNA